MKRVGRNDPCPCGSGKKWKKCHLLTSDRGAPPKAARHDGARSPAASSWHHADSDVIPDEVMARVRDAMEQRRRDEERFGKVRPLVSTVFNGYRIVGVGSVVHWSKTWRTFVDFLLYYIRHVLGAEWGNAELAKPASERHPVIQWFQHSGRFMSATPANEAGLKEAVPDGVTLAYLALAYDLYLVGHHVHLQERLVERLRHPDQFQGARYELAVLGTLVRAGFDVEFEDETDSTQTHPEYTALHRETNRRVSVEAKSRHRAGVLGFGSGKPPDPNGALGVGRLLAKALKKDPRDPYLIFIDANYPPDVARAQIDQWLQEVGETIQRLGHGVSPEGVVEGAPFNALFVTNFAHYYGAFGEAYPQPFGSLHVPVFTRRPGVPKELINAIEQAIVQYGNIPKWSE